MRVYGSTIWKEAIPSGRTVKVKGMYQDGIVHSEGLILFGCDGNSVSRNLFLKDCFRILILSYSTLYEGRFIEIKFCTKYEYMSKMVIHILKQKEDKIEAIQIIF